MKLSDLLAGVEVIETDLSDFDADIPAVSHDSEGCTPGGMFICISGLHYDGNDYIGRAVFNGARYIVSEKHLGLLDCLHGIRVPSARAAMARIYSNFYGNPASRLRMIGVTGTNGKTTTTYMLQAILNEAGHKTGLIGTVSGSMTTPDPDLLYRTLSEMAGDGMEFAVMEASSHALALDKLCPIHYEAAIFTNLTPEHLDFHGTMDRYLAAKAKLFSMCDAGFFNYDDEYGQQLYFDAPCRRYFYSAESDCADFVAKNIVSRGTEGIEYQLLARDIIFRITAALPGRFNVSNTLAAASCAYTLGVDTRCIRSALSKMRGVPGRIERVPVGGDEYTVFIDYAHTPDALENVLRTVRRFMTREQRLVLLFGCGGDRDRTKRPVMGAIASRLADFTIVTSDNSRSEKPGDIIAQILRGMDRERPYTVIENRRDAIEYAVMTARRGDVILLAGKGHEDYEIDAAGRHPFSEREIVAACDRERRHPGA